MNPWFVWKGESSLDYGLWISELPAPRKANERTEEVVIPGRSGSLLYRQGKNIHDAYTRECRVTAPSSADYQAILTWLSGTGEVIFSNEPDRVYRAEIVGEVQFTRDGNSLKNATIPFTVHPHKGQYPPEPSLTYNASGTVYNPGTIDSLPLVEITFTQTCTVALDGAEMTFTSEPVAEGESYAQETITVDCEAQIITCSDGIWRGTSSGDFWALPPGESDVTVTGASIVLTPRWRWY